MNKRKEFALELGRQLKKARLEANLSQTQVMALTNINNKTLSGYENGLAQPDLSTLTALARLYQISLDQILQLKEKPDLNSREKNLLKAYRSLSSERQMEVLIQINALAYYLNKQKKRLSEGQSPST
ncbi:MAG: helix-turn-helix domain-containing protein [Clostridia bacterium]|nr:helix-turn-helix domain-containing protein [Clostridia bacterium]